MPQTSRRVAAAPLPTLRPGARAIRNVLALMFAASCIMGLDIPHALAADASTATSTHSYNIAAGALGPALSGFAAKSGVSISAETALVTGLTTKGLQGNYLLQEGFKRLLDGSGLEAVSQGNGNYTLRKIPTVSTSGGDSVLPEVSVTALRSDITEGTGSYTVHNSSAATKLNLSLRETPQTVTVVTRQKMDDFGLTTVENALESTSTIFIQRQGGDGAQYYSRGFRLQSQYDGMPNPLGIGEDNFAPSPDSSMLDRVEILQGASGLMSGAGEPGGTVNLVRKRPTEKFQAQVEAQVGSWGKKRLVADLSGSLIESGRIRGRAVVFADHSDSFTDYVFDNREGFYGVVEADLTPTTLLGASITYQKNKFNNHYGVPMAPNGADLRLPRSSFFGVADGDSTRESTSYRINLEQKLPGNWLFKAAYTHSGVDVDGVASNLGGTLDVASGNGLRISRALQEREFKADVLDVYASGPFDLFGRQHELVLGATSFKSKYKNRLGDYVNTPINIYNFDRSSVTRPSGALEPWPLADITEQQAAYAVSRFNLTDSLKLIVGARASWYEFSSGGIRAQKEDAVISPYAGLVYDINKNYSAYVSYSDVFKPQSSLTNSGSTVKPVVGKNYEIGLKGEFLDGRLNASAAIFRLEQTNLAEVDQNIPFDAGNICGGLCYVASGLVVSKGVDLSLNGEVMPGWQIGAGYTYVDSKYGSGEMQGKEYATYTPDHILRTYTSYRLPNTNWTVGANVRLQSKIYGEGTTYRINQGAYAVLGLMAKYQVSKQMEITANINNLFDRRYYDTVGSYSTKLENFYGAPRNAMVSLKYAF